jgi:WD40 repeat protein
LQEGQNIVQGLLAPNGTFLCADPGGATKIAYSPCGKYFGLCSVDEHVTVYEIVGHKARKKVTFREHTHMVLSMAWSPDSSRLVSVGADKQMILWHVQVLYLTSLCLWFRKQMILWHVQVLYLTSLCLWFRKQMILWHVQVLYLTSLCRNGTDDLI